MTTLTPAQHARYQQSLQTKKLCLPGNAIYSSERALWVTAPGDEFHPRMPRAAGVTATLEQARTWQATHKFTPSIILNPGPTILSIEEICEVSTSCSLVVLSRAIHGPLTILKDAPKNILFIEDVPELYEHIPPFNPGNAGTAELIAGILLRYPRLLLSQSVTIDPGATSLKDFYCRHVGTIQSESDPALALPDIVLIQQFFAHPNEERAAEFGYCLCNNLGNPFIDIVLLLTEGSTTAPPFTHEKLHVIDIGHRLTFHRALQSAANAAAAGIIPTNAIIIIANLDIYFDATLTALYSIPLTDTCLALLRWETPEQLFGPRPDSQDAWIFQLPLPAKIAATISEPPITDKGLEITLGYPGCDNCFLYELLQMRVKIFNPAYTIHAIHRHTTKIRNYSVANLEIRPTYVHVTPTELCAMRQPARNEPVPTGDVFVTCNGGIYTFHTDYTGVAGPRAIHRTLTVKKLLIVPVPTPESMSDPIEFLWRIFPQIAAGLREHPDAECILPDQPQLYSTFMSYMIWPTPQVRSIPYHPTLHLWAKEVVRPPVAVDAAAEILTASAPLLAAIDQRYGDDHGSLPTSRLLHAIIIACAEHRQANITWLRENTILSTRASWGGIVTLDTTLPLLEAVRAVRNADIVIVDGAHKHEKLAIFARPNAWVIDFGHPNSPGSQNAVVDETMAARLNDIITGEAGGKYRILL